MTQPCVVGELWWNLGIDDIRSTDRNLDWPGVVVAPAEVAIPQQPVSSLNVPRGKQSAGRLRHHSLSFALCRRTRPQCSSRPPLAAGAGRVLEGVLWLLLPDGQLVT
jgi:hypothetical protein